ncbi:MAG: hypothetical protein HYZ00_06620 [Candidatus Hydrogenedentes bacterium]|nr:hypothetical protein [Candidatus Hydrogenedentota bacterium]
MRQTLNRLLCRIVIGVVSCFSAAHAEPLRDWTVFQEAEGFQPEVDFGSDVAIVYGTHNFEARVQGWREHGYGVSMMTGIAWGAYGAYYGSGNAFKRDEVQTDKNGKLFMHGDSTDVGYNIPSEAYVEFIKQYLAPPIRAGVQAIYLEEPEYWADTGWSESFKREWQEHFNEPWRPPNSSVDAQYRASRLKYELYFEALRDVIAHIKQSGSAQGHDIECHVPTHTLLSYAHWRIVSPESHLVDIPGMDGYIAQVWTGTARTPNIYAGERRERTFDTAFLEYAQAVSMVRPTGRKLWFLADPVEDNPNRSWNDYRHNYEATVIASLLWPEVYRYEVMPWPHRIFRGAYPKVDLDTSGGAREGIPADYATELLTVISALNDMKQDEVVYDTGNRGVGILVSDTMMFQRADPERSDPDLGFFYGLALPLLKAGIPVEVIQLENVLNSETLRPYRVALLSYEGQKPLRPEYHAALNQWVRDGGALLYCENGSDPYHHVRAWWNTQATTSRKAYDDLFERLGLPFEATPAPVPVGKGFVGVLSEDPSELQRTPAGADAVRDAVRGLLEAVGDTWTTRSYLRVDRGPYVILSMLEEPVEAREFTLRGRFVDLLDPTLSCFSERTLAAGQRGIFVDVDWWERHGRTAGVVAAAGRVRDETSDGNALRFTIRGPSKTRAAIRLLLPRAAAIVTISPEREMTSSWDEVSSTLLLSFEHQADARVEVAF